MASIGSRALAGDARAVVKKARAALDAAGGIGVSYQNSDASCWDVTTAIHIGCVFCLVAFPHRRSSFAKPRGEIPLTMKNQPPI